MTTNNQKYGWWMSDTKPTTNLSAIRKRVNFPVSYCQVCEQSWEKEKYGLHKNNKPKIYHYTHLPICGMDKKVCPQCIEKYKSH